VDRYAGDFDARAEDASVAENVKENTPRAEEGDRGAKGYPVAGGSHFCAVLYALYGAGHARYCASEVIQNRENPSRESSLQRCPVSRLRNIKLRVKEDTR